MNKFYLTVMCCSVTLLGVVAQAQAQEAGATVDQEEMMEKWQAFMTPGDEHALLKEREGTWDMTIQMWMDPSAPPSESKGTSVMKMIMGGRYLLDNTTSTFDGMPFEGMAIVGYDNMKKKFISTWIDNMGTGIMTAHGTYDESAKTMDYEMMGPDVMTGKYEEMHSIEKTLSKDEWTTEMYRVLPDGKQVKSMVITYKRKK